MVREKERESESGNTVMLIILDDEIYIYIYIYISGGYNVYSDIDVHSHANGLKSVDKGKLRMCHKM